MTTNTLKKALNDGRFGDGVHYTITGKEMFYVSLNNTARVVSSPQLWANTIWFKNITSGEVITLDWVISIRCMYDQAQCFISSILSDYVSNFHGELDYDDVSGEKWTAAATSRALTKKEVQSLIDQGAEIFESLDLENTYDVLYDGELLPYEEVEFETELLNKRPDIEKIFKRKKKRK